MRILVPLAWAVLLVAAVGRLEAALVPAVELDPALPPLARGEPVPPGTLHSVGSDAMAGLMGRWAVLYAQCGPGRTLTVEPSSPAAALPALGSGRAQLAPMGRRAYREEREKFAAQFGYPPLEIVVARCTFSADDWPHPHAVIVHPANPLSRLSLDQVDAIFSTNRARGYPTNLTTWGQLGLTGAWQNQPIVLYGVDPTTGPGRFFREQALRDGPFKPTLRAVPNEAEVSARVAADRNAIGFTGTPFALNGVKRLALAEASGQRYSEGSLADVASGRYPLGRVIYLYLNRRPGTAVDPAVAQFVRVVLSRDGQAAALAEGYLPLSAALAAQSRIALQ